MIFFSNIVQKLDITRYSSSEPFLDVMDSTTKGILKYRNLNTEIKYCSH